MRKKLFCLLLLATLSAACNHHRFTIPCVVKRTVSITSEGAACIVHDQCATAGPQIRDISFCNNAIGVDPDDYLTLFQFYDDKLMRLEICLKHPKKCR